MARKQGKSIVVYLPFILSSNLWQIENVSAVCQRAIHAYLNANTPGDNSHAEIDIFDFVGRSVDY